MGPAGRLWRAFLRLFFRLLYHEFAWAYDLVAWVVSLGRWEGWGRAALPHLQGKRVLELGHGPGHLLAAMEERSFQPVGLDRSPQMGRQAGRRLKRAGLAIPLVRARAQALPFHTASFDSIAATFPTEFILDSDTLQEVKRALKPHGRAVVVASAIPDDRGILSRFLRWLYRVTGQEGPAPGRFEPLLAEANLTPRFIQKQTDGGKVKLVLATPDSHPHERPAHEAKLS